MALDKAIKSGKEHRKPYRGSKAFDPYCRNHGNCSWCAKNRQHKFRDKQKDELKEWRVCEIDKHGYWEPVLNGIDDDTNPAYDCSECGAMCSQQYDFCPICGAKMDLPNEMEGFNDPE